jgi:hypothetical protein
MAVRLGNAVIHSRVCSIFAQKRVAGQSVRVHVLQALPVLDFNVVLPEEVCPACRHAAQALVFHEPLQRLVNRDQDEVKFVKVDPKMHNRQDGGTCLDSLSNCAWLCCS